MVRESEPDTLRDKKNKLLDPRGAGYTELTASVEDIGTAAKNEIAEEEEKPLVLTDQEKTLTIMGQDSNRLYNLGNQLPENSCAVTVRYRTEDTARVAELFGQFRDRAWPFCSQQIHPAEGHFREETFLMPSAENIDLIMAKAPEDLLIIMTPEEKPETKHVVRLQNKLFIFDGGTSKPKPAEAATDEAIVPEAFPEHLLTNRKIISTLRAEGVPEPLPGEAGLPCSRLMIDLNAYFAYCNVRTDKNKREIEKEKQQMIATIGLELKSKHSHVSKENNVLVVTNSFTHHGSTLGKLKNELDKITDNHLGMLEVTGRIATQKDSEEVKFAGSPTAEELSGWKTQNLTHNHQAGGMPFYSRQVDLDSFKEARGTTSAQFHKTAGPTIGSLMPVTVTEEVIIDLNNGETFAMDERLRKVYNAGQRALQNPLTAMVEIRGAGGTGKSALLNQLIDELPPERVLRLRVDDGAVDIPGAAIISLFSQLLAQIEARFPDRISELRNLAENPPPFTETIEEEEELRLAIRVLAALDFEKLKKNEKHDLVHELEEHFLALLEVQAKPKKDKAGEDFWCAIDDLQFLDTDSNPMMKRVCTRALQKFKKEDGKGRIQFPVGLRPEERIKYAERHSSNNEHRQMAADMIKYKRHLHDIKDDSKDEEIVTTLNVQDENNNLVLNLQDPRVALKFAQNAVHEFLVKKNRGDETIEAKKLSGNWHIEVAKLFDSPIGIKYFYAHLAKHPEEYMTTSGDSPEVYMDMDEAEKLRDEIKDNTDGFLATRISESKLSKEAEDLLQCIALIGDRLPIKDLLEFIGATDDGEAGPISELFHNRLIKLNVEASKPTEKYYQLMHSTLHSAVLKRMMDSDKRKEVAGNLHEKFKKELTPGMQRALLSEAATDRPHTDTEFWAKYDPIVAEVLKAATDKDAHTERIKVGLNGLGDLSGIINGVATSSLGQAAVAMCTETDPELLPNENIQNVVINQLQAVADAGRFVGAFEEAYDAMQILKKILDNYPKMQDDDGNDIDACPMIDRLTLGTTRMETALVQRNADKMKACMDEDLEKLFEKTPTDPKLATLEERALPFITRFKYYSVSRKGKELAELEEEKAELIEELKANPDTPLAVEWRIYDIRRRNNRIVNNLNKAEEGQTIDYDIPIPESFSDEDKKALNGIVKELNELEAGGRYIKLSSYQRRYIKDTRASANRALGKENLELARKEYGQLWFESMKENDYPGALRATCEKAKIYGMMAFAPNNNTAGSPLDFEVKYIHEAIRTLNDEGRQAMASIESKTEIHKWNLHADRIRYLNMALLHELKPNLGDGKIDGKAGARDYTWAKKSPREIYNENFDYIQQAAESIVYIQEYFSEEANDSSNNYYLTSYCLMFLDMCTYMGIKEIPLAKPINGRTKLTINDMTDDGKDEGKCFAFFTEVARQRGIKYSGTVKNDKLQEKQRKMWGLYRDLQEKLNLRPDDAEPASVVHPLGAEYDEVAHRWHTMAAPGFDTVPRAAKTGFETASTEPPPADPEGDPDVDGPSPVTRRSEN